MRYNRYSLTHQIPDRSVKAIGFGFFGSGLIGRRRATGLLTSIGAEVGLSPIPPNLKMSQSNALTFYSNRCKAFGLSEQACLDLRTQRCNPNTLLSSCLQHSDLVKPEEYVPHLRFHRRCKKSGKSDTECTKEVGYTRLLERSDRCKNFASWDDCADYYNYPKLDSPSPHPPPLPPPIPPPTPETPITPVTPETPETPITPVTPETPPTVEAETSEPTPTTATIFGMNRKTLILGGSLVGGAIVLALILKKRKQTQLNW